MELNIPEFHCAERIDLLDIVMVDFSNTSVSSDDYESSGDSSAECWNMSLEFQGARLCFNLESD